MQEVRYDGIRVAYVLPGSVNTGFWRALEHEVASGRKLMPEDVAEAVLTWSRSRPAACQAASRFVPRSRRRVMACVNCNPRTFFLCPLSTSTRRTRAARDDDGRDRGRLAVALDLLTDALAMVGQHGVYCQSARTPRKP